MKRKKTVTTPNVTWPYALLLGATMLTTQAASAQEVVRLGFTGPLSGGAAQYGKNVLSGIEMAVKEINAAGFEVKGKKYKFEVVSLDDKYAPSEAAINARRLVQQSQTAVVFVPHAGGVFALQAFNQTENFLLMAYTSVPKVTETGNKLTVRVAPAFTADIGPYTRYESTRFGKKLGMAPADHDYAKAWVAAFGPAWEAAGGTVVSTNPMSYNKSTDFYSGVSRVLADKPDVLFAGGPSEPTALVVKQARELGFKGGFALMDQAKMNEMADVLGGYAQLEGSIGILPLPNDPRAAAKGFVAAYSKAYGADHEPTTEASLNYTMVYAVANAMKLAGSVNDPAAIRAKLDAAVKALPKNANPNEVSGVDDKGGAQVEVMIGVVEGGKLRALKATELAK